MFNQPELKQERSTDKQAFGNLTKAQQQSYQNSGKLIGLVEVLQQCDILKTTAQGDMNEDTKATGSVGGLDSMAIADVAENVSETLQKLIVCLGRDSSAP